MRGQAFGFHRMMDTAGAILGSFLALGILIMFFGIVNDEIGILQIIIITSAFISLAAVIPILFLSEDKGSFSHQGCEICNDGLGNLIYDCHGYNPTTGEIQEVYQICRQCLYLHANGEEIE